MTWLYNPPKESDEVRAEKERLVAEFKAKHGDCRYPMGMSGEVEFDGANYKRANTPEANRRRSRTMQINATRRRIKRENSRISEPDTV